VRSYRRWRVTWFGGSGYPRQTPSMTPGQVALPGTNGLSLLRSTLRSEQAAHPNHIVCGCPHAARSPHHSPTAALPVPRAPAQFRAFSS
jgi:hypothetical protein